MASVGNDILSTDINALQTKASEVLGPGSGTYGYGQSLNSSPVSSGQQIAKSDFDAIRFDIVNILVHQTGSTPSAALAQNNIPVRAGAGDPINNYDSLLITARSNRFNVEASQQTLSAIATKTYSSAWSTSAEAVLTLTFSTATQARYFFNSGGKIRMRAERTGGTSSQQNNAWTNLLDSVGDQTFGADNDSPIGFYELTNSYETFYTLSASTPYSANNYTLSAKCNVANNSTGTATTVDIKIALNDTYVDAGPPAPGDSVDGNLEFVTEELKASGILQPTLASWVMASPTYSMSNITAT